jgi:ABC-2 type transport system ATP-binding protein
LDGINLNIPKGSIYGLLGPNGAGKTSFIRIMNQITAPDEGEVILENIACNLQILHALVIYQKERGLYKKMKVGEQVLVFRSIERPERCRGKISRKALVRTIRDE